MEGLVKFREAFAEYSENYVVIGGAACDITMTNTVVRPRATHDIDMIVIVENMTEAFANRFWQFVREAGYRPEKRKQEAGEPPRYEMYRFLDGKDGYPEMIELLSRHPDVLGEPKGFVIELSRPMKMCRVLVPSSWTMITITYYRTQPTD